MGKSVGKALGWVGLAYTLWDFKQWMKNITEVFFDMDTFTYMIIVILAVAIIRQLIDLRLEKIKPQYLIHIAGIKAISVAVISVGLMLLFYLLLS